MTELEMLKELKEDSYVVDYYSNYLDDIEYALIQREKNKKELEQIKSAKPSEALEELENVIEEITIGNADLRNTLKTSVLIATIKQALLNFDNIIKQINDTSSESAISSLNKIKDKLDAYTYNTILEALLKTQEQEKR